MTCICLCACVSVLHDLYVSVCLYVGVIGDITYLQATLLAANFITDSRYLLTTLLTHTVTYLQAILLTGATFQLPTSIPSSTAIY